MVDVLGVKSNASAVELEGPRAHHIESIDRSIETLDAHLQASLAPVVGRRRGSEARLRTNDPAQADIKGYLLASVLDHPDVDYR